MNLSSPNVLFIVVDDLNTAFEQYGGHAIAPNLGRLARDSVQFQNAHVSVPICGPSRTAFLTGLRPDTSQVWTIGPYFRDVSRGEGPQVITLPEHFRRAGFNVTGAGKIFHPGHVSGGIRGGVGGGDQCPAQSAISNCSRPPSPDEPGSWSEPYQFCDQWMNDTVQSPAMGEWPCAASEWPSCGAGCVQDEPCIKCLTECGTWGQLATWAACDCPDECYPEGLVLQQSLRVLREKAAASGGGGAPWFHAVGFKRPHLSWRAPRRFFEMYDVTTIPLPLHRYPSASSPPISYMHSCREDDHIGEPVVDELGMGRTIYADGDPGAANCQLLVMNRSRPEFNGSAISYVEVNTNDTAVRELRRAYYAAVSFTDFALGKLLDGLCELELDSNTLVTFMGDHGFQLGQKGEWCKSTLFELATRIPMYVRVPPSLEVGGKSWRRGVREEAIVESLDLYPTLADLAGLPLPPMRLGGESLRPLLEANPTTARSKTWALSQWPRRPICTMRHRCFDGGGDPWRVMKGEGVAIMGYRLRTSRWAYIAWVDFDWGVHGDPLGNATYPLWERLSARELYDHYGDDGSAQAGEEYEWTNLAYEPRYASLVEDLHRQLQAVVRTGLVKPMVRS